MVSKTTKEEYNDIPVYVCTSCGSLHIKYIDDSKMSIYCVDCGGTNTKSMHIHDLLKKKNSN